jgi:CBS domain-containing protein
MTREVIACRETDDVARAEEAMARHRKSRIMVLSEHGRLTGVISLSDVVEEEDDDLRAVDTVRHVVDRETHA